jgi:branched-subunit amino acid ABC-type transport system permease component
VDIILSSISQGLLWSVMAIGVYLTFRILDIADMTAEGSYPLGAAVCATGIVNGLNPLLATFLAMIAGMGAGFPVQQGFTNIGVAGIYLVTPFTLTPTVSGWMCHTLLVLNTSLTDAIASALWVFVIVRVT